MKYNDLLKTDRTTRLDPKTEMNTLAWLFGGIIFLFIVVYYFSEDNYELLKGQAKIAHLFFIIYIMRLFLYKSWVEHYKETISKIYDSSNFDKYSISSILNVLLDLAIIFLFIFFIEDKEMPIYKFTFVTILFFLVLFLQFLFTTLSNSFSVRIARYIYILFNLLVILSLFWWLPDSVLFAKAGFFRWLPFLIIFCLNTTLIYIVIRSYDKKIMTSIGIAALSVLIIGPLFGLWQDYYRDTELKENGIKTIGIVHTKWLKNPKGNNPKYSIKSSFIVKGKAYFTSVYDLEDRKYSKGDTISIIYSINNPELNLPYWKME